MPDLTQTREVLLEKWNFDWPVLNVLISGHSSIDLPQLFVEDFEDATKFIQNYGYNPEVKEDARFTHSVIIEAINFIENVLMPSEWKRGNQPPEDVLLCEDVRYLLVWASSNAKDRISIKRKKWSCAILRVMHTIAHIGEISENVEIKAAREQIFTQFEKCLFRDSEGGLRFGDHNKSVAIECVEWKVGKSRESIILKLLHKPANVAETIFDRLGVRIVTKYRLDTLVMVQFLRDFFLVTFPNTTPSRSKNTLINIDQFRPHLEFLWAELEQDKISAQEFVKKLDKDFSAVSKGSNPHSSKSYKSIQLTCRQLIRYESPNYIWRKRLMEHLHENSSKISEHSVELAKEIINFSKMWTYCKKEQLVFFPFEVQIINAKMAKMIETGDASHDKYKKSQIRAARKRVLSQILN